MDTVGLDSLVTTSLSTTRRAPTCLVPGASAVYLMDEGSGTTLTDRSGNGHDGTFGAGAAAPTWAAPGLTLDGGDLVTCGTFPAGTLFADATHPFTVQAVATWTTGVSTIVAKAGGTSGSRTFMLYNSGSRWGANLRGTATVPTAQPVTAAGAPYILEVVWDGTAGRLVIDGVPHAIPAGAAAEETEDVTIGARTAASPAHFLTGGLMAAALYPRALTDAERMQNRAAFRAIAPPRGLTLAPEPVPPKVLISFDDARDCIYTDAFPILAAAGMTATVYVTSDWVGDPGYMTEAQLATLYAAGWDIGNHGVDHTPLSGKSEAEQTAQIDGCSTYLEGLGFTRSARHLSYPGASYDATTLSVCATLGILSARTTSTSAQIVPPPAWLEMASTARLKADQTPATLQATLTSRAPSQYIHIWSHGIGDSGIPYVTGSGVGEDWSTADFRWLVGYLAGLGVTPMTLSAFYAAYAGA